MRFTPAFLEFKADVLFKATSAQSCLVQGHLVVCHRLWR
jgi:hypothetical protein